MTKQYDHTTKGGGGEGVGGAGRGSDGGGSRREGA